MDTDPGGPAPDRRAVLSWKPGAHLLPGRPEAAVPTRNEPPIDREIERYGLRALVAADRGSLTHVWPGGNTITPAIYARIRRAAGFPD